MTVRRFRAGGIEVAVIPSPDELAEAAARKAAEVVREAITRRGRARIVVATGNSQIAMMERFVQSPDVDWSSVEAFHLDEYVGLPITHPASFRLWIRTRFADRVRPGAMHYLDGEAPDLDREIRRYTALIREAPFDLCFAGFGENGHIGFNDPPVADFHDPLTVKRVKLDEACRRQQVGEGHFPTLEAVPPEALTMTCPAIVSAGALVCVVPDRRKAQAVKDALEGEISTACPASLVRTHSRTFLYLDTESVSLLSLLL